MKTVTLIGDSIRMGYEDITRRELRGLAEVRGPAENGGDSRDVLAHLEEWAGARKPDIIHLNCGLHDLRREFGQSVAAVPIAEYESNVRQIFGLLRSRTQALVIWAATTPVNEQRHHARKGFDRFEADVNAYNAAATRVAQEFAVPVNDLFAVAEQGGRNALLQQDGVHFTPEGYARLGKAVAQFISALGGLSGQGLERAR
jgi:lysophospholipase L1-like esterase